MSQLGNSPERLIVSVHFPKSSGTSLSVQLKAAFKEKLILDYEHDPLGSKAGEIASELPPGTCAVHGHFRPHRYANVPDAFRATLLREPVQNLISIYYFWQTCPPHGNRLHERFLIEQPSIIDFARYPGLQSLMSETYFGGYDMNRFDFIGFYDRRAEDFSKLSNLIGFALDPLVHENITANGVEERRLLLSEFSGA